MSDLEKALEILFEAEESLSSLMREALAHQRYDGVAAVAEATQLLADLVGSLERPFGAKLRATKNVRDVPRDAARDVTRDAAGGAARDVPREAARDAAEAARGVPTDEPSGPYPRFARDGDRLVKVGWSSKARQEYKHRTHRKVLRVFARAVRHRPDAADCFTMEDVLPLVYAGGKEIPSYQAYLALALLRSVEAIRKDGRDGYRADLPKLSDESLNNLWESLPEHA